MSGRTVKFGLQMELRGNDLVVRDMNGTAVAIDKVRQAADGNTAAAGRNADASRKAAASTSAWDKSSKSLAGNLGTLRNTLGVLGIGLSAAQALRAADNWGVLDQRIVTATKDTGDYIKVQAELFGISQQVGSAMLDNVALFQRMSLAREALEATTDEMLLLTAAVGQLGVIGGATNEAMAAGTRQFAQALSATTVRAEEINSVIENLPELAKRIEDGLGLLPGTLKEAVNEGRVLSRDVFDVLVAQAPQIAAEFEQIEQSIGRSTQSLLNSVARQFGLIDDNVGTVQGLAAAIKNVSESVDEIDPANVQALLHVMLAFGAARYVPPLLAAVGTQGMIAAAGMLGAAQAAGTATASLTLLRGALAAVGGPAGLAVLAGFALYEFTAGAETAEEAAQRLNKQVETLYGTMSDASSVEHASQQLRTVADEYKAIQAKLAGRYTPGAMMDAGEIERLEKRLAALQNQLLALSRVKAELKNSALDEQHQREATAAKQLTAAEQALIDVLMPAAKHSADYTAKLAMLNSMRDKGKISVDRYEEAIEALDKAEAKLAKAAEKAAAALAKKEAALQGVLDATLPLRREQRELESQLELVNAALEDGAENTDELVEAKARLEQQLQDLNNPFAELLDNLEDENVWLQRELEATLAGTDALAEFNREKAISAELRRAGIEVGDEEYEQARALIAANYDLSDSIRETGEAQREANQAWQYFVTEMVGAFVDGADNIGDVFDDLLDRLKREALNNTIAFVFGFEGGTQNNGLLNAAAQIVSGGGNGGLGGLLGGGGGIGGLLSSIPEYLATGWEQLLGLFGSGGSTAAAAGSSAGAFGGGSLQTGAGGWMQSALDGQGVTGFTGSSAPAPTVAGESNSLLSGMNWSAMGYAFALYGIMRQIDDIGAGMYGVGDVISGDYFGTKYKDKWDDIFPGLGTFAEMNIDALHGNPFGIFDSPLRKIFGGKKHSNVAAGVRTGPGVPADYIGASGLQLDYFNRKTEAEDVQPIWDMFTQLDQQLFGLASNRYNGIDLAGMTLDGRGASYRNNDELGNFFGAVGRDGIESAEAQVQQSAQDFVESWLRSAHKSLQDAGDSGFDPQLLYMLFDQQAGVFRAGVDLTLEELVAAVGDAFTVDAIFAAGGHVFDGLTEAGDTFALLRDEFMRTGESALDTVFRLHQSADAMDALGIATNRNVEGLRNAQEQVDALGADRVAALTAEAGLMQALANTLDVSLLDSWEASQRSAIEVWRQSVDEISAFSQFAGNPEGWAVLGDMIVNSRQLAYQLFQTIDQGLAQIAGGYGALEEQIIFDRLGAGVGDRSGREAQHDYLSAKLDNYRNVIGMIADPELLLRQQQDALGIIQQAYGLLTEEERYGAEGQQYLEEIAAIRAEYEDQLARIRALVAEEHDAGGVGAEADAAAAIDNRYAAIAQQVADAVETFRANTDRQASAAAQQQDAAAVNLQAAGTPVQINLVLKVDQNTGNVAVEAY